MARCVAIAAHRAWFFAGLRGRIRTSKRCADGGVSYSLAAGSSDSGNCNSRGVR